MSKTMERDSERFVYDRPGGHPIGFIRRTKGGFYRAYKYVAGVGVGPFESETKAEEWIRKEETER